MVRMAREEGPRSFLMGVKSRVGWIAPFTAISLGLNNVLRRQAEEAQLKAETLMQTQTQTHGQRK